jgi:hypothetical protein
MNFKKIATFNFCFSLFFCLQMLFAQEKPINDQSAIATSLNYEPTVVPIFASCNEQKPFRLVRNQIDWNKIYNSSPRWPMPVPIDFNKNMLVIIPYAVPPSDPGLKLAVSGVSMFSNSIQIKYFFYGFSKPPLKIQGTEIGCKAVGIVLPQSSLPIKIILVNEPHPKHAPIPNL